MKWLSILVVAAVFYGCSKREEISPPVIEILSPGKNASFTFGDTIDFRLRVTSYHMISSVKTGLVDENLSQVLLQKTVTVGAFEADVSHAIPVDDPYLISGSYRLQAVVSYEGRLKHDYLNISVSGLEKSMKKMAVISYAGPQQTRIDIFSSSYRRDSVLTVPYSFSHAASLAGASLFCFLKKEPAVVYAYSDETFLPEWSTGIPLPYPRSNAVLSSAGLLFISTGNGNIMGLDGNGSVQFLTPQWEGFSARSFSINERFLVAEMVSLPGAERSIAVFYMATATEKNRRLFNNDIYSILPYGEEFLLIHAVANGYGVSLLDPVQMTLTAQNSLNGRTFHDAERLGESSFLILDDNELVEYDPRLNRFTTLMATDSQGLEVDEVSGNIVLFGGREVSVYAQGTLELLFTEEFGNEVLWVEPVYNK